MRRQILFRCFFFAAVVVSMPSVSAKEEESAVVKTADKIIEGLPAAFKTGLDFSKMTPEQRIDFVLTGVESKVQDSIADKFNDEMLDKMKSMAKEGIRAKMFLDVGLPQIKHAYAMGQAFDWSKIDAQLASEVDTRMTALSAGLKTVQIGWSAYEAYNKGSWEGAARCVGGKVADMMAEAVIPGYGYIKIGAEMVEFLGNYVLDYATDTAVEGMLESMYGLKANPQGLAEWLIKKSPADIMKDIDDKFEWGAGMGYVYRGQGTDSGESAIKSKIQQTLVSLRGDLLVKKKEQEQKEQRLKQDVERYLEKYKAAQQQVKQVAEKAAAEADKNLKPIRDFRQKMSALRKEDAQKAAEQIESQMDDVPAEQAGSGVPYFPLNRAGLISDLEAIYAEIKESPGSGFDIKAIDRMLSTYTQKRDAELRRFQQQNSESCQSAIKQIEDQFRQPMADLSDRIWRAPESQKDGLISQLNALSNQYSAQMNPRRAACSDHTRRIGIEIGVFSEEERIVRLEAQERADKLTAILSAGFAKIAAGVQAANEERDRAMAAFFEEVSSNFAFPSLFTNTGSRVEVDTCAGICGLAESIKQGQLDLYSPGSLAAAREEALYALERLRQDAPLIGKYSAKEREILGRYHERIRSLRREFEALVVPSLRAESLGGQENSDAKKAFEENVAKYGTGNAGSETWTMGRAPLVDINPDIGIPEIKPPVKYFDQQMSEVAKLEQERTKKFQEGIRNVESMIQAIDFYADLDRIAVQMLQFSRKVEALFTPWLGVSPGFSQKDGAYDGGIDPEESDGTRYLNDMKKAWDTHKPLVEKLRNLVKAYGKGLKYISLTEENPDAAIARLGRIDFVESRIASMEQMKAQAKAERDMTLKNLDEEFARLQKDFKTLQDEAQRPLYVTTLKALRITIDEIFKHSAPGTIRAIYRDKYVKLRDEVEAYAKKREQEDKKNFEDYQRQQDAESKAAAEAEKLRREKENAENLKYANPQQYYGYQLLDQRVNSYSVAGMSGDVVIARDKLVNGQIQVTARLNHLDKAAKLLISTDGGRTLKEIPLRATVDYSFTPIPNKIYQIAFRVTTSDQVDVSIGFTEPALNLVYQDADFSQQVVEAVQALANAYERQDMSAFSSLIAKDFLGNKTFLEEGVRFDFDLFSDIQLKISINRIEQRGTTFVVETHWDKSQTPRKTGQVQKTAGTTTMMFVHEDGALKIRNLRGNLIYATLSPEIAQASGLPASTVSDIRTAEADRNPTQPGAGTTDDNGGGTTSGTTVTVTRLTPANSGAVNMPPFPGNGYDFTAGASVAAGDAAQDVLFETNQFFNTQIQKITDGSTFDTLETAPTSGYSAALPVTVGGLYVLMTTEGYYVKLEVLAATPNVSITFKYAVQSDGTTNIATH